VNAQTRAILSWIIVGLVAGFLASFFAAQERTLWFYLGAGLVGAIVGGGLAQLLKLKLNSGNPFLDRVVFAGVGAIIALVVAPGIF
jgi:uncharacterized membrane protein YeaQ/YmgE (transglycosylase-associated protein family)